MDKASRQAGPFEIAFALGWHLALLYYLYRETAVADAAEGGDPGVAALVDTATLPFRDRAVILRGQIEDGIAAVFRPRTPPGGVSVANIVDKACTHELSASARERLLHVQERILIELTRIDFSRGKAFSVGCQLSEICLRPLMSAQKGEDAAATLGCVLEEKRIRRIKGQLWDLKTYFEAYAVDAVVATLDDWGKWVREHRGGGGAGKLAALPGVGNRREVVWGEVASRLYRQGGAWRAMLFGEELPTDMLQVSDYVDGAGHVASRLLQLALRALGNWKTGAALGGSVAIAGVVGVSLVAFYLIGHAQGAATGILAALGAVGVTGASVTASVKRAASGVEKQLWDSELAASIASAINLVPGPVRDSAVLGLRSRSLSRPAAAVHGQKAKGG